MPARKQRGSSVSQTIEKPEIILLCLPLVCLGLVLLVVFLNSNAASGEPSPTLAVTAQVASLATPTPAPTAPNTFSPAPTSPSVKVTAAPTAAVTSALVPSAAPTSTIQVGSSPGSSPGVTPPAGGVKTVKPGTPEGNGIRLTKTEGELKFELLVSPGHIGDNTYSLLLSENGNQAVTDASLVRLSVTSLDMDMGVANLDLQPAGPDLPGLYSGLDSKLQMLSMFGKYNVAVLVRRPAKSDVTTSFQLMVTGT